MGTFTRAIIVVLGLVSVAEAKPKTHASHQRARHPAGAPAPAQRTAAAHATQPASRAKHRVAVGHRANAPWQGKLVDPAQFPDGDGYHIRRPWRSYGTRSTVDIVHDVVTAEIAEFPDHHVLAIGDFSAEHGGRITEHASHQSGRDVDIGLYYTEKPDSYPETFVSATDDNLDCEATYGLVDKFVRTQDEAGGAQIIFLDYRVQGMLYDWAKDNGVSEGHLDRMFQYPHGKSSGAGFVRHWPNHDNHIHVRFKCGAGDAGCR